MKSGGLFPLLLTVGVAFALALSPVWDYDVWFQLACGKAIVALRGLPTYDLFSYTATDHPWDTQEWLSQVLFYLVYRSAGLTGLTVFKALIAALIFFVVFQHAATRTRNTMSGVWIAAGLCTLAAYAVRWSLVERPQIFSLLFLASQLFLLSHGRSLWSLLPLTLIWANLHGGSVLIAPGVLALWITGQAVTLKRHGETLTALKWPALIWLTLFAAITANPAGINLFLYPFETMSDKMYMLNVLEWTPPTVNEQPGFFLFLTLAAAVLLLTFRSWSVADLLIVGACAGFALTTRRHIPLFCLAVLPPLAEAAARRLSPLLARLRQPAITTAVVAWLAAAGVLAQAASHGEALTLGVREDLYPAGAVARLREAMPAPGDHRTIRVFGLHQWGGYLLWHLPESFKVFIDGRQLVYGPELFLNYYKILENTAEAENLLTRYAPDVFVLDYNHSSKLSRRLSKSREAALIFWDDTCLVSVRRSTRHAALIGNSEYRAYHPERAPSPNLEANLKDLDRAAREAPGHARPWTMRAKLLLSRQRLDEAWAAAREALRLSPRTLPVLLTAFEVALAQRDLDQARALLKRVSRADDSGTGSNLARAKLKLANAYPLDAFRALDKAIHIGEAWRAKRKKPESALAEAYHLKASQLRAQGKRPEAAEALRQAGNVFYELGRLATAKACYEEGLRLAPSDMRLLHNLGSILVANKRYQEALRMYRQALALAPRNPDTHVAMGVALYQMGRTPEARAAWQEALALEPGHANARAYLERLQ